MEDYKPSKENEDWLTWLLTKVQSVPYKVPPRWAFYRLVQEKGFAKGDYKKFLQITSKARKAYWNGWAPDTLPDDTRTPLNYYGLGFTSVSAWFDSQRHKSPQLQCEGDQESIVFVGFEAKAMTRQFQHYLDEFRVCLLPFGGDASVPYKYQIAELIDEAWTKWKKPIKFLYFGDFDPKGLEIPENAMRDIEAWASAEFEFIRIGINEEHIALYNIPDNPDAPGKYQWEALDDESAHELIERVFEYWSKDVVRACKRKERRASEIWAEAVDDAIQKARESLDEDDEEEG